MESKEEMYYWKDLSVKVIEYAEMNGAKETSKVFSVGTRTISRRKKLVGEKGNLNRTPLNRKARKLDMGGLRKYVEEHPDAHLKEMAKEFKVNVSCVHKALMEG
ncbi:MAG: transposase [Puniceicoccales bacterium]|nr:transposase [Puniceicoccales bacterium]